MNLLGQVEPLLKRRFQASSDRGVHTAKRRDSLRYNNGSNEPPDHHAYCREFDPSLTSSPRGVPGDAPDTCVPFPVCYILERESPEIQPDDSSGDDSGGEDPEAGAGAPSMARSTRASISIARLTTVRSSPACRSRQRK